MKQIVQYFIVILFSFHLLNNSYIFTQNIFKAHRAGTWYPKDKKELKSQLKSLIDEAKINFAMTTDSAKIKALICPHAGYEYSGRIAAAAYRLLDKNKIDQIIILGPSHFLPLHGIALPEFSKYQTPLGTIDLNTKAINHLKKSSLSKVNNNAFKPEHSVEMQIPFIQFLLPSAKIVPVIVGNLSEKDVIEIASSLKPIITQKTILVISSDFTHYGKAFDYTPFKDNILLRIRQLDSAVLNAIQHQDRRNFQDIINNTKDTVCGYEPLRILLELIKQKTLGNVTTRLVAYGTSADKTKDDNSNIVTYSALISTNETNNTLLNMQEKRSLLIYSRNILTQAFKKTVDSNLLKPIMTLFLEQPKGAFTTFYIIKNGKKELRGCIGQVEPIMPLYETVAKVTLETAFADTRFKPVTQGELPKLLIEISFLEKTKPIKSYKDIILNKHGIILKNGTKSALFLPKMPEEYGFDLIQTLQELSLKAGLDKDA